MKLTSQKLEWKNFGYHSAPDLYNSLLTDWLWISIKLFSDENKKNKCCKHNFSDLFLNGYEYNNHFDDKPDDVKLKAMIKK